MKYKFKRRWIDYIHEGKLFAEMGRIWRLYKKKGKKGSENNLCTSSSVKCSLTPFVDPICTLTPFVHIFLHAKTKAPYPTT